MLEVFGWIVGLILLGLALLSFSGKSVVRKTARIGVGIIFALTLLLAIALVVGSVVLSSRGGGVLVLFALPPALVAWISGKAFFASVEHEAYFDLTVPQKMAYNLAQHDEIHAQLEASVARKKLERAKFWTSARRREELAREIAQETKRLNELPKLRPALEDPRTYAGDEP
ncbi:MAG: hypothetical protein QY320_13450 [Gammaproteobacteria bacterium]|nr:MAG: hypothetical protein QY320_13450 [Gammaproteobacteria bacterium]